MRISLTKGELLDALNVVSKGLSSRSTLPILSGILVTTSTDGIVLQSTDLEISIRHSVAARVEEEGQAVIPGKLIADITRSLPDAAVTLETNGKDKMSVSCGQSSFSLKVLPAEDFPRFPETAADKTVTIPTAVIGSIVRQVSKAVSRDETRPILTGVLVSIDGSSMKMVATDSYRLSVREDALSEPVGEPVEVVIPGKAIEEASRLAGSADSMSLGVSENQVVFEFGDTVFVSRRIEGNFPNYRQLISDSRETRVTIERQELLDAVKRVSLMAQHNAPIRMKVAVEDQTLTLTATTQDVGEAKEDLPVQAEGQDVEMAFNHAYLADGVSVASSDQVTVDMISPLKPGIIRSVGDEVYTYVLMPVRIG